MRGIVGRSIERAFPPKEAGLLLGLLLGDDSELDPALERDFRASGLSHLLVVSGGNVAMVLAPVLAATALLRLPRWPKFAVGFGAVAFFTILTGAEPSVLRAGVMACLALVGVLMGRPRTTASILAGAVFALLVLDPWLAWSVGFQLSVTATAGMVALASPLADRFGRFLPRAVATAAGATLSAQLGVTPVLLFYFSEVPLVTLPANLAAFPLVSPSLLLGAVAAGAGPRLAAAGLGTRHRRARADARPRVRRRPPRQGAGRLPHAPRGERRVLIGGTAVVVAITVWIRTGWRPPRVATVLSLACLPAFVWASALGSGPPAGLTIQVLDVGQGDAILVTSPAGASILVDGGPDERMVATQLAALGVKRLDMVVATHPHADHVAGLPTVLSRVPVGVLLQPGCSDDSPAQVALDRAIRDEDVPEVHPRTGDVFRVGDLRLEVLSPDRCWTGTESDANNDSIVILLSLHEDTVLLTGDAEIPVQEWLLEEGIAPRRGCPEGAAPRRRHVRSGAVRRRPRRGRRRERGRGQRLRASERRDHRRDRCLRRADMAHGPRRDDHRHLRGSDADGRVRTMTAKPAPPVTLLWGEDDYLLREAALALLGETKATEVDAAEWEGGELQSLATPSLFGEPRALLVNDAKSLRKETLDEIGRYLAAPDPDATLVLVLRRRRSREGARPPSRSSWSRSGEVRKVDIARKELEPWLVGRAKELGLDLAIPGSRRSSRRSARSPASWSRRSASSRTCSPGSASALARSRGQFRGLGEQKTWDLCDRAFGKDLPGAIRSLRSIEEGGDEAIMVLGGIAARLRDLLKVRSLPDRMPPAQVAKEAGLRFDWQARRYQQQARNFSMEQLVALHDRVTEADRALKSGATGDIVMPTLVTAIAG